MGVLARVPEYCPYVYLCLMRFNCTALSRYTTYPALPICPLAPCCPLISRGEKIGIVWDIRLWKMLCCIAFDGHYKQTFIVPIKGNATQHLP